MTTTPPQQTVQLDRIHAPANVRELDPEHVKALAGSIALQGVLVPVVVRANGDRYELVAGFHRLAAARAMKLAEIPVVIRDAATQDADRAVENIARKQLSPYEEALAVKAMLAKGLTEGGAAQALGWAKARVSARVKLLELPERAQKLAGTDTIPLAAVDQLREIGRVSPPLLDTLIAFLAEEANQWAGERLAREPGWVLGQALRYDPGKAFAEYLNAVGSQQIAQLRLGKKTDALYAQAEKLHKQLDRYSYGPPRIAFTESDIDQARAAGVLIDFEQGAPIVTDRGVYRELAKGAVKRTAEQLQADVAAAAAQAKRAEKRNGSQPADPIVEARRERDRQLRQLSDQAHGVNLDLGAGLLSGLATVDPANMDVARFFVFALLGADHDRSADAQAGEPIARIAGAGIRLVVDELRADVTKTLKDGSRGRLRIDYGRSRGHEQALAWLWRFIDGAGSAGELYGRALVVLAAEQYASRLVLPASQRSHPASWGSHKDLARKAIAKLAGPHLPASLARLEKAVARVHSAYAAAEQAPSRGDRDSGGITPRAARRSGAERVHDTTEHPDDVDDGAPADSEAAA